MSAPSYTRLPPNLSSPPPPVKDVLVSFPSPHVLLVQLNRPRQLNAIPRPSHFAFDKLWTWYDEEPYLRCAIITGSGRAFSAGADLKEWAKLNSPAEASAGGKSPEHEGLPMDKPSTRFSPGGFGGISNRSGVKPIIAAVNGICFGGGMEIALNCDLVIASEHATFSLPEVTIGVVALAGALPRLARSLGKQRAAEMALSGKKYTAHDMLSWGLVNDIVKHDDVVQAALAWAEKIAGNSPDAVIVTREALKMGWEPVGPQQSVDIINTGWYARIEKGDNMVEGVKSFVERRKPMWKNSKL
ncbi:enoyl-hydratase [Xylariaceae sp. FL1272]|nr:enoyl-hydratase [Xylariaceae sp. FL1272]